MEEVNPEDHLPGGDSEPLVINRPEPESTPPKLTHREKLALFTVSLAVLGYYMPVYIYSVVIEQDVNNRIASTYNVSDRNREDCLAGNNTNETAIRNHIDSTASNWMILTSASNVAPAFFVSLFIGPISDKIGRKILFLIPIFGAIAKYVGCLLVSYYQWPIWAYSIPALLEGLTGGSPLYYAGCIAYTADNTDVSRRSFWIVMVDVIMSTSAVIANFCSGYIISGLGYTWSYIIMAITVMLILFIICLLIQGSPNDLFGVKILTMEHLRRVKRLFTKDNGTNRRWKLNLLLLMICLFYLGNIRLSDALTYTMLDTPLCFSSILVGNFFSIVHVVMTVGGFLLICLRRCGAREIPLLYVSYLSTIGLLVMLAFANDTKSFFSATVFSAGMVLGPSLVNSLMSPLVGPDEQGALFSAVSWIVGLMLIMTNVYQNAVYSASVSAWRSLVFVVCGGMIGLDVILLVLLTILWKRENDKDTSR